MTPLPALIRRFISPLTGIQKSDADIFNKAAPLYQSALDKSGYSYELKYERKNDRQTKPRRPRTRNITWYNPPFDLKVETNLGREFLRIINDSFPQGHVLKPIFNRNTLKLSYSCMPSVKNNIDAHNTSQLKKGNPTPDEKICNCRDKTKCPLPLNGECREKGVIYQATVTKNEKVETYVGLTDTEFKSRHSNHKVSFNNRKYEYSTELSKYIWTLKDKEIDYKLEWKIIGRASSYSNTTKRCNLCLLEKYFIICHRDKASLNKRSELVNCCRHSSKFLLKNI